MAAAPHALEAFGVSDAMMRVPSTTKMRALTESPASTVPPAEELVSDQALIDGIEGADSEIAAAEEEEEVVEEEVVKEEVVEEKVVEEKTPGSAPAAISEPEAGA